MARHTSWRVGGTADRYFEPVDQEDLVIYLRALRSVEPVLFIGLGSNLLVRDGGIRGTVINTVNLASIESLGSGRLRVEAGVPCAKVARATAHAGYTGAEFLCGIPGTMGGALAMNAGAFGGQTWDIVERVTTIDRNGVLRERDRCEFETAYRVVNCPAQDEWFVASTLLVKADVERAGEARIRGLLAKRTATQPTGVPSCGSVFRNPVNDFAGRLIETCGLKGRRIGGAHVSDKHANFIITEEGARAADLEALLDLIGAEVKRQHGVTLIPEVRIVGEAEASER